MSAPSQMSAAIQSGQQAWIYEQFNGTTYQANAMDVQHEPIYDTVVTAAGATIAVNTSFFTNQQSKTLNQTNVQQNKQLQAPEAFTVMGINFSWLPTALLADIESVIANFALELWIGQKSYNRGPISFYNSGTGLTGAGTTSGLSVFTNGTPAKGHRHELAINIVIDNQSSFYGNLVGVATALTASGSGGTGITLIDLFDGLHARGVQ